MKKTTSKEVKKRNREKKQRKEAEKRNKEKKNAGVKMYQSKGRQAADLEFEDSLIYGVSSRLATAIL